MNNPFKLGISTRCFSRHLASGTGRDVAINVKVRKERRINVGARSAAATKVHRVWAVQTHAIRFCLGVAGVLGALATARFRADKHLPCTSRGSCIGLRYWY